MTLYTRLRGDWPFAAARAPIFYGWVIALMSTLGFLMSIPGQTMGMAVFADAFIDATGLSRTQLSTAYLLGTLGSAALLTRAGRWYDRFGARILIIGGQPRSGRDARLFEPGRPDYECARRGVVDRAGLRRLRADGRRLLRRAVFRPGRAHQRQPQRAPRVVRAPPRLRLRPARRVRLPRFFHRAAPDCAAHGRKRLARRAVVDGGHRRCRIYAAGGTDDPRSSGALRAGTGRRRHRHRARAAGRGSRRLHARPGAAYTRVLDLRAIPVHPCPVRHRGDVSHRGNLRSRGPQPRGSLCLLHSAGRGVAHRQPLGIDAGGSHAPETAARHHALRLHHRRRRSRQPRARIRLLSVDPRLRIGGRTVGRPVQSRVHPPVWRATPGRNQRTEHEPYRHRECHRSGILQPRARCVRHFQRRGLRLHCRSRRAAGRRGRGCLSRGIASHPTAPDRANRRSGSARRDLRADRSYCASVLRRRDPDPNRA